MAKISNQKAGERSLDLMHDLRRSKEYKKSSGGTENMKAFKKLLDKKGGGSPAKSLKKLIKKETKKQAKKKGSTKKIEKKVKKLIKKEAKRRRSLARKRRKA